MLYDNLVTIVACMVIVSVVFGLTNKPSKEYKAMIDAQNKDKQDV